MAATVSFHFSFVAMLKFFFSFGQVFREQDQHFSYFLCSILDMNKNGYVGVQELTDFVESMECSDIETEVLDDIRDLLNGYIY